MDLTVTGPKWLPAGDPGYFYNPGGTNAYNYLSAPDDGTTFTGDMSIAVRIDAPTFDEDRLILTKRDASDGSKVPFNLTAWNAGTGTLKFQWCDTGGTSRTLYGSVNLPAAASVKWVGVQHDSDNGAGGNTAHFYYSLDEDATTWTLLQSVTEGAVTGAKRANTAAICLGGSSAGVYGLPGKYYEAKIWDSMTFTDPPTWHIDIDADVTNGGATSFTATTGQTVSVYRSTSSYRAVLVPTGARARYLFDGSDDYMETANHADLDVDTDDPFTVWAVARTWATLPDLDAIVAKKDGSAASDPGWVLYVASSGAVNPRIADGTFQPAPSPGTLTAGEASLIAVVRDVDADTITGWLNTQSDTVTDTTTGSPSNTDSMRVGRLSGAGTAYAAMEWFAAGVCRRVLTSDELAEIFAHYT